MTDATHVKYIDGDLVHWDTHRKRLVWASGQGTYQYNEDFIVSPLISADSPLGWTVTLVETGAGESTITKPDGSGGTLLLTTDNATADGINMQLAGESFGFASTNKVTYFGIRFQASEATTIDILAGLCITDTTLIASSPTDGVWFDKLTGATGVNFRVRKGGTETAATSLATFAAATNTIWEFYWDQTAQTVEAFINGTSVSTPDLTNLPNTELLTPSIAVRAGSAVARTMTIDWIRAIGVGR